MYGEISVLVCCDFSGSLVGSWDSFSGFGIFIGGILGSLNFSLPSPPNFVPISENNGELTDIDEFEDKIDPDMERPVQQSGLRMKDSNWQEFSLEN